MNPQALKVLFFGTPTFSVFTLRVLLDNPLFSVCGVVTQPDKPAGRGQSVQASPVKLLALENKLPVFQPKKIRGFETEFLQEIASLGPVDFCVVIAFGQILPQAILDYPKLACINIHASLLPRWRGAAPIQRSLLAGDKETGVCIMKMEAGLDTGPVYSKASLQISENDNASSLHDKLAILGAGLLVETLPKISTGLIKPQAQPEDGVTYAEKLKPADFLINWQDSAESIELKIKVFSPKPGAYCFLEGKRLKILKAELQEDSSSSADSAIYGKIESAKAEGLKIRTGNGFLNAIELQLEGKKALPASEFIKGYPGLEGKVLGS